MNATRIKSKPIGPERLYVLLLVLGACAIGLIGKAFSMQVLHKSFYQDQGDARFLRDMPVAASRGPITDRRGEPLAISTPMVSLWAEPRLLLEARAQFTQLAPLLGLSEADLVERLESRRDKEFIYLRRLLPPEAAEQVLALGLPGLNGQREYRRFYPGGEVFAHVVGYTDVDDQGQEGLELAFDSWLLGKPGVKRVIRNRRGETVENIEELRAAEPGQELRLTLDRRLQYLAHRELKAAIFENSAASGSMVILDVPTGEVLAMVNYPSYNPNARGNNDPATRRNRAVTDVFEPGSVIKSFTVAAGLESGKFKPDTEINTHPGTLMVANHLVRDIRDFGVINPTRVLTKSSNVGATRIAQALDDEHLYDMYRRFGFGQSTGSGFPGESAGTLPEPNTWGAVEKATLSYGYGLSVTTLQLAQSYAALANGGLRNSPTFILGAETAERESQLLDPEITRSLVEMLETVTGPEGGAIKARVLNYRVAGKTGTARRASAGGYENRHISVFAGMVPASRPRLAAAIVIHDPQGGVYYGGLVAAPVFGRVMDDAMRLLNVAPDALQPALLAQGVPSTIPAWDTAQVDLDLAAEGVMP
ncbi:MAG: penicillin-binding protein 2 [Pseudomonadota bacterium]|nr:penicillin-binding protein 2 [Pseudomonadota bacterium]